MSKFTGSKWKKSRRLGFSVLETGDELKREHMALDNMAKIVRENHPNMVLSWSKNKN